jgi:hypothetical protein
MSATGTANVIGILMEVQNNTDVISSVSGGGVYIVPAGCVGAQSTSRGVSCAYTLVSTPGATTITVTRSSTTNVTWRVFAVEASFTGTSVSLDTGGSGGLAAQGNASSGSPPGPTLTLSGGNVLILQGLSSGTGAPTAISGSYSSSFTVAGLGAFAYLANTTSGTAPTWTTSTTISAVNAMAFREITSGGGNAAFQVGGFLVGP